MNVVNKISLIFSRNINVITGKIKEMFAQRTHL